MLYPIHTGDPSIHPEILSSLRLGPPPKKATHFGRLPYFTAWGRSFSKALSWGGIEGTRRCLEFRVVDATFKCKRNMGL